VVSLRWSEEEYFGLARSINIASLRDGNPLRRNLPEANKKFDLVYKDAQRKLEAGQAEDRNEENDEQRTSRYPKL
jgi:hypothetical protein